MIGDTRFEAAGQAWILAFSVNGLVALEDVTGKTAVEVGDLLDKAPTMKLLRQVFWAGLQEHHEGVDLKATGRLMSELGTGPAGALLGKAFLAAWPQPEAGAATEDPPSGAGTG